MTNKVYQMVTDQIIKQLEQVDPHDVKTPWFCIGRSPVNLRGTPYRGINHVLLSHSGFGSNIWGTFNQWQEKECSVKKGERSQIVVLWKFFDELDDSGENTGKTSAAMTRYFRVFNSEQVKGEYARNAEQKNKDTLNDHHTVAEAKKLIQGYISNEKLPVRNTDNAYYASGISEHIGMPELGQFDCAENYYRIFAHEITHSTGNKKRLNRDLSGRFGDQAYAFEELVAELGSAMLCGAIGLEQTPRLDHAKYIKNWLTALRNDQKFIISAASQAQKAADYITQSAEAYAQTAETNKGVA